MKKLRKVRKMAFVALSAMALVLALNAPGEAHPGGHGFGGGPHSGVVRPGFDGHHGFDGHRGFGFAVGPAYPYYGYYPYGYYPYGFYPYYGYQAPAYLYYCGSL